MGDFPGIGKFVILIGLIIVAAGIILTFIDKIPFLGKLPGDISYKKGDVRFYIPIATGIVLSVVASLIIYIINHFFRR